MKRADAEGRFWLKVDRGDGQGCWLWTASVNPAGYGYFRFRGRTALAHRAAYQMLVGPIGDGLCLLHNCPGGDNPRCVNPAHLRPGTHADNVADKIAKGHQPRGRLAGGAKLTEEQVLEVVSRQAGGETYRSIAASFGVKLGTITAIILGKNWGHVSGIQTVARGPRQGSRSPVAKLTEAQVRESFARAASGETQQAIAESFGVSQTAIGLILRGRNWAHLTSDLRGIFNKDQEKTA